MKTLKMALILIATLVPGRLMPAAQTVQKKNSSIKVTNKQKKALAALGTEKILHPTAPKTQSDLFRSIESKEEKKLTEELLKNDLDEKTWLIIKSLKPGQSTDNIKGKSGKQYSIRVRTNGAFDIAAATKK